MSDQLIHYELVSTPEEIEMIKEGLRWIKMEYEKGLRRLPSHRPLEAKLSIEKADRLLELFEDISPSRRSPIKREKNNGS